MQAKTAVVIGSTGLIGQILVQNLAKEGGFNQILAIIRDNSSSEIYFNNPKIRLISFDFKNWSQLEMQIKSFIGTSPNTFFCCLGTTIGKAKSKEAFRRVDHDYVVEFAKLAKSCRTDSLLVVSALGAEKNSDVFYSRVKGEMESAVASIFDSGKLHFLRPSLLLGDRQEFRLGERLSIMVSPIISPLLIGPLAKYRPVKASAVAKTMIYVANKKISASQIISNEEILKS